MTYGCEAWTLTKSKLKALDDESHSKFIMLIQSRMNLRELDWLIIRIRWLITRILLDLTSSNGYTGYDNAEEWLQNGCKKLYERRVVTRNRIGRLHKKWNVDVEEDMLTLKVNNWRMAAVERRVWRTNVEEGQIQEGCSAAGRVRRRSSPTENLMNDHLD